MIHNGVNAEFHLSFVLLMEAIGTFFFPGTYLDYSSPRLVPHPLEYLLIKLEHGSVMWIFGRSDTLPSRLVELPLFSSLPPKHRDGSPTHFDASPDIMINRTSAVEKGERESKSRETVFRGGFCSIVSQWTWWYFAQ
jgi:hypothetical protein